jgi:arylformamidase
MSFDDLPRQPSINPNADAYALECLKLSRETAGKTRCVLDVKYGDDYWQKVDVYLPAGRNQRDLPVFVFVHGGGWTSGYKEWCGFMAEGFVEMPCIFVSASHRLIPHVAFPQPCHDVVAAIKWIWDHIGELGGSRDRIVVGGHSAGGHLTALLAVRSTWFTEVGLPRDVIKGCMALSATFNRRWVNEKYGAPHVQHGAEEDIQPDSPIALAGGARAPFYVAWGGREHPRLERSGKQMIEALRRAGCAVEHEVFPNDDHFSIHLKTRNADDPWTRKVRGYLARTLEKVS